jgi:NitT/TauT family transport system substrate-binding protein
MQIIPYFKRLTVFLAFAAALVLPLVSAQAQNLVKLNVGAMPITGHAKVFVAKERGYFESEGLDVELALFTSSSDAIAAFRAGKLDIVATGISALLSHISWGMDALLVGGQMGNNSMYITTTENAGTLKSVDDFKGKKVAVVRTDIGETVLRWALAQRGLEWGKDISPVELKNPPAIIEAVKKGQADAGVIWRPFDQGADKKGIHVAFRSGDLMPGHPCCRIALRTESLNAKPEIWVKFFRAILKAERYSQIDDTEHRDNTVDDIAKYVRLDKELVRNSYYGVPLDQTTDPNADGIQKIWNVMNETKIIDSKDDIQKFIEPGPYRAALESLIKEEPADPFWAQALKTLNERDSVAKGGGRSDTHWK